MTQTILMEKACKGQADVETFAAKVASLVQAGDILALTGDLGAGKTTFSRAFVRAALKDSAVEVPSPTFTLVQSYDTDNGFIIFHTDLYRLHEPDDVYDLGLDDERAEAVLLVEWPDRMPEEWWQGALEISLKRPAGAAAGEDEERTIILSGNALLWRKRLEALGV